MARRALGAWLRRLVQVRDTPEASARGLAIGFFFGVSALFGLQLVLAVLAAHLLRGNKVLAAAATAVSNPLTSLPLYTLCYLVGHALVGGGPLPDLSTLASLEAVLALGPSFLLTLFVGTTTVGVAGAVLVYLLAGRLLAALRRRAALAPGARCAKPEARSEPCSDPRPST